MCLEGGDQRVGACQEQARIPQVAVIGEECLGLGLIRLFDEAFQCVHAGQSFGPSLEPAIAGLSAGGLDAEGDDLAVGCGRRTGHYRIAEGLRIGNGVIGGHQQHQGLWVGLGQMQSGGGSGGGCVAPFGFNEDARRAQSAMVELFGHDEAEPVAGDG